MTARITETDAADGHVIRLEGSLGGDDALLVERLCADAAKRGNARVFVEFDAVCYLDEAGATVMRRVKTAPGVVFRGCCLFTERLLDDPR
jgi:hypothetical protein